jgi:SAM-dependent methyltransferase
MWRTIPLPYIPCEDDWDAFLKACPPALLETDAAPRILILGVTPPLVIAPWPAAAELYAVDFDQGTIDTLWQAGENRNALCERWQDMSFEDDFFDLIIGDCSFNALPGLDDYAAVIREIDRVRKPGVPIITRFFLQPQPRLTLAKLKEEASGAFSDYRPYARLMLVPIAASEENGTLHATDTAGRIIAQCGDVDEFLVALGLDEEGQWRAHRTFEFDQYLNFPDLDRITGMFEETFPEIDVFEPAYDCGAFCPTIRFR